MTADVTEKILRNTFFIFVGRTWFLVLSIALTPYLLGGLGAAAYGVWILVDSLVRTLALVDFGFATSFVKHVAEHDARGEPEGVSAVLSCGLVFYGLLGLALLGVAWLAVGPILDFFTVPEDMVSQSRQVLAVAIAASVVANLMGVFQSVINGLQRMDVTSGIMVGISTIWAAGCVVVVEGGHGILGLAVLQLLTQVIGIALSILLARRLVPGLHFTLEGLRTEGRRLFRYGLNVHLSSVAALVNTHFDKMLVSRMFGATHVAYYDVGARPPATGRSFAALLLSALIPATSELEVREGRERLYELFVRTSRFVSLLAFPLFLGVLVTSRPITEAWVGSGYGASATVMSLLCVGYLFHSFAGPVSPFVLGMGWPQCQRNAESLSLVLNVALSLTLVTFFGFFGAPAGTSIAMVISSIYYLAAFHRFIERPLRPFVRDTYLKPVLCSLGAALCGGAVSFGLMPQVEGSRLAALGVMLATGLAFGLVYVVGIRLSGYLESEEILQLKRYFSLGWLRRKE